MLADIDRRMKAKYSAYGLITKRDGEDIISGMARYCQLVMKLCDKGKADGVLTKIERYIDRFKE